MFTRKSAELLTVVLVAATLTFAPGQCWSQQVTAAITGKVTDPSGASVLNAAVTATDTARGSTWPTLSNAEGIYDLPRVPVGTYNVKVEAQGFQTAQQSGILLVLNQTARLDFQLRIGNSSQSVEVTGVTPLLKTDSTQLDTVIDARTNEALPLATRNYVQLTLLAPGSVTTNPSEFTGPQSTFSGGRPYINGNREEANTFLLDGMDNNQVSENAVGYSPGVDAIEEFNMITNNASAEFGHFMGGIISVSIKSGTNQLHGTAFEFLRNDALNANTWQNDWSHLPHAILRWNEFGGSAGGPIRKNKLFFFADYQGSRFHQPATSSTFTVLTPAERTGDFSQLLAQQGIQLHYPHTTTPIPGNIIPNSLLSPQALAIISSPLYPQPVTSALVRNAISSTQSYTDQDQGDAKVDWNASTKDHLSARYSQSHIGNPTVRSIALLYNSSNVYPSFNSVVDYTRTFSPTLVNEFRVGVNYMPYISGQISGNAITAQSVGIPAVPTTILPAFTFTAGNLTGGTFGNAEVLSEFADTVGQISDTAIWSKGNHTMHLGFQFYRYRINTYYSGNAGVAGQFNFSGQYSGAAEADFLLGMPTEVAGGIAGGTWGQRASVIAPFFQDDWRVGRNLTLNLGLRWELQTPWVEVENRQANFGLINGVEYLAGVSGCPYSNCRALYNQYNGITNFQPRVGLAWVPGGGKTVIRAAFTTSSFLEGTGTNARLPLNPPFATEHDIQYTPSQTPSSLMQGYTIFGSGSDPATEFIGADLRIWDPKDRPAVSNQWNFTVQRQFVNSMTLQAAYVGQRSTHLMIPVYVSQEILNPNGTVSQTCYLSGNPTLQAENGYAKSTESTANQDYAGLQVSLQKRLAQGLEFQANYTWSKCMTDSWGFYGQEGSGGQASAQGHMQNTYNLAAEWGPCYYDVTHAFNGFVTYDLPFGRGRSLGRQMSKALNAVAGEWRVNMILNIHGGFPLTIYNFEDSSQTKGKGARGNCVAPAQVFGEMDSPRGGYQWLNPNDYAAPPLGTFGTCGVGTVRGPGLSSADVSVSKTFAITERQNVEFRAETINITNTPILAVPNTTVPSFTVSSGNIGTGTFGQITSAQGARQIQFALKLHF